jgi:hypothetical protein
MDIYDSLERLKKELEELNFLVMAFIDLDSEAYLRVIQFFKNFCNQSERRAFIHIHVIGHGHHLKDNDFLVPVNSREIFHKSDHNDYLEDSFLSSYKNLQAFMFDGTSDKFQVNIFWDLCRSPA